LFKSQPFSRHRQYCFPQFIHLKDECGLIVIIGQHRNRIRISMLRHLAAASSGTAVIDGRSPDWVRLRRIKMQRKCLLAAVLLATAVSTASAQNYWRGAYGPWGYGAYGPWSYGAYGPWRYRTYGPWRYRESGLKARGYYGTPYGGGPQYGSGGGDQYGYGPAYSYARQAPSGYPWR
jgi:hypothetical protein